jgi:hypothetical protein
MPELTDAQHRRVVDDLLVIKDVMRRAKDDWYDESEVSEHPWEVRVTELGLPVFLFGGVAYAHFGDGTVSESRTGFGCVSFRRYDCRGRVLESELTRGRSGGIPRTAAGRPDDPSVN